MVQHKMTSSSGFIEGTRGALFINDDKIPMYKTKSYTRDIKRVENNEEAEPTIPEEDYQVNTGSNILF